MWLYHIFPLCPTNGSTIFGKIYLTKNVCSEFLYNLYLKHSSFRRIQRDIIINVHRCPRKTTRYSCQTSMNLEFSRQILDKSIVIKFNDNLSSGSRVFFLCGRTIVTKLTVALSDVSNTTKCEWSLHQIILHNSRVWFCTFRPIF